MPGADSRTYVLSLEEVLSLSAHATTRSYPKGTIVVSEGDRADSLFIIVAGRIKAYVADAYGKEVVLSTQGVGEYFGEMMLDEGPRSASVMTLEKCTFLVVPKADFRDFLLKNPQFAAQLVEKLIRRVRALTENVKSLALMDVYGRVARQLIELAEVRDGTQIVPPITQREMASRVGASREMVSRILKDLATGGYITQSRSGIVLHRKPPARW